MYYHDYNSYCAITVSQFGNIVSKKPMYYDAFGFVKLIT